MFLVKAPCFPKNSSRTFVLEVDSRTATPSQIAVALI